MISLKSAIAYFVYTYSFTDVQLLLSDIKEEGRNTYKFILHRIDSVCPLIYGILMILITKIVIKNLKNKKWKYLFIILAIIILLDYFENVQILNLLNTYPNFTPQQVCYCSTTSFIK